MNIGLLLRKKRAALELTQQEVADLVGVSKSAISRWETGDIKNMGLDKLKMVSKTLNIDPLVLINEDYESSLLSLGYAEYPFFSDPIPEGIPYDVTSLENLPFIPVADLSLGKYARRKDLIIMRVNGESMNKVIQNGSFIGVIRDIMLKDLHNGDVVVFHNEHEYSLKRYFKIGEKIIFRPDSTEEIFTDTIFSSHDEIKIVGRVVMYSVILD